MLLPSLESQVGLRLYLSLLLLVLFPQVEQLVILLGAIARLQVLVLLCPLAKVLSSVSLPILLTLLLQVLLPLLQFFQGSGCHLGRPSRCRSSCSLAF